MTHMPLVVPTKKSFFYPQAIGPDLYPNSGCLQSQIEYIQNMRFSVPRLLTVKSESLHTVKGGKSLHIFEFRQMRST